MEIRYREYISNAGAQGSSRSGQTVKTALVAEGISTHTSGELATKPAEKPTQLDSTLRTAADVHAEFKGSMFSKTLEVEPEA
jgi:hypothetical protein